MRVLLACCASLSIVAAGAPGAEAATFCVDENTDTNDGGCSAVCNPGGGCSLREAITAVNAAAGADTIIFSIAGAGPHTIAPATALPPITDAVLIDGFTQPGAQANTLAIGNDAVMRIVINGDNGGTPISAPGLSITGAAASGTTVRGLVINAFSGNSGGYGVGVAISDAGNVTVEGCFIGTNAAGTAAAANRSGVSLAGGAGLVDCRIGGTTPAARNVISGNINGGVTSNSGTGLAGCRIQGNYIGTNATGTAAIAQQDNIIIQTNTNGVLIGGASAGARNVLSGSNFGVTLYHASNHVIMGNYIGVSANGLSAIPNVSAGIAVFTTAGICQQNQIGGPNPGEGNLIAGNPEGVRFSGTEVRNNRVEGNRIGTNANGAALPNTDAGVALLSLNKANTIGGLATGAGNTIDAAVGSARGVVIATSVEQQIIGNTIRNTGGAGIVVSGASARNRLSTNSIATSGTLAIDLALDGLVASNDAGDGDGGPNDLQNFPVTSAAFSDGVHTRIVGSLPSSASASFVIEFFANASCDNSGNGLAERYLGASNVLTDGTGNAAFDVELVTDVSATEVITATATDSLGSTSELSACQAVVRPGRIEFVTSSVAAAEGDPAASVTVVRVGGSSGAVSATITTSGTAVSGSDYAVPPVTVSFADGDTTPKVIALTIIDDAAIEGSETAVWTLAPASGNVFVGSALTVTITDDDACGDGQESVSEACDDANTASGDGCSASCVVEVCGDGVVNDAPNEACDGSAVSGCAANQVCSAACACVAAPAPTGPTGASGSGGTGGGGDDPEEEPPTDTETTPAVRRGCGCGETTEAAWWLMLAPFVLWRRRRGLSLTE
ncbi:MAG: hypothetical protein IT381_14010 [Deltaproteobacteria bacterium]|nr:hypothetical protein [Deltaproteobacteria bacterium]